MFDKGSLFDAQKSGGVLEDFYRSINNIKAAYNIGVFVFEKQM